MEKEDPFRVGVCVSSSVGSLQAMEKEIKRLLEKGPGRVGPLLVPMMISNMAAGNVSIAFGCRGKSLNVVTACATGSHSIGEAYRSIQAGEVDVMLAGGTEAAICPIGIAGFASLTALTSSSDPERASIPFDKERSGFVMGEGAGVVVFWKVFLTLKPETPKFWRKWPGTAQLRMHFILHRHARTAAERRRLWNLPWKRPE